MARNFETTPPRLVQGDGNLQVRLKEGTLQLAPRWAPERLHATYQDPISGSEDTKQLLVTALVLQVGFAKRSSNAPPKIREREAEPQDK